MKLSRLETAFKINGHEALDTIRHERRLARHA